MPVFEAIAAVAAAIPVFDKWLQDFFSWYTQNKISEMRQENVDAIKKALSLKDQRELEKLIGNPNAGEVSGIPGTIIVDSLPGVPKRK